MIKKLVLNAYLTLTMMLVMVFISVNAQDFKENFLGFDFIQYKGALLKLKDKPSSSAFGNRFYGDIKYCQNSYDDNVIYPNDKYNWKTTQDSLANRIFLVEDIVGKDGKALSEGSASEPIFLLRDTVTKQIIYYLYSKGYSGYFPFLTSGITIDMDALCSKIKRKADDFTNEVKFHNPIIVGRNISPMILYKYIKDGKVDYYLNLIAYGSTVNVGETGVIILFDDGTKMNKPTVKISVDTDEGGFEYSAYIPLTETEVKSLTMKNIKKFRLYIYDRDVGNGFGEKFANYVKCILEKK